jgi:hypothetical protein
MNDPLYDEHEEAVIERPAYGLGTCPLSVEPRLKCSSVRAMTLRRRRGDLGSGHTAESIGSIERHERTRTAAAIVSANG